MSKPWWEQEWKFQIHPQSCAPQVVRGESIEDYNDVVAERVEHREALGIAAAPEMARALRAALSNTRYGEAHTEECATETQAMWCVEPCTSIRAVLIRAGVPLP